MEKLDKAAELTSQLKIERPYSLPGTGILVGTSAFTAAGWEHSFYTAGMKSRDFLTYYATQFGTVEVDSTFYRTPSLSTVTGWYEKTPPDFVFAAKVPRLCRDDTYVAPRSEKQCLRDIPSFGVPHNQSASDGLSG